MMDEINQVVIEAGELLALVLGGPIPDKWSVHCETIHDEELRNNRLPLVADLMSKLAWSLMQVSSWKGDYRASAKECGTYAYDCLTCFASDILEYIDPQDANKLCREWLDLMAGDE